MVALLWSEGIITYLKCTFSNWIFPPLNLRGFAFSLSLMSAFSCHNIRNGMQYLKVMQEMTIASKYDHIHSIYSNKWRPKFEENCNLTQVRLQSILENIIYSVTDPVIKLTPLITDSGLGNPKCYGIQNQHVSFST